MLKLPHPLPGLVLFALALLAPSLNGACPAQEPAAQPPPTQAPATLPPATQELPAQEPPAATMPTPGGMPTPPRSEPAVEALTRRDASAIALALTPGVTLLLHDFDFNGDPVTTDKIHLHQLAPGVFELISNAYTTGSWRFHVADSASYYGLGAHFDTLDHAHTIVRNLAVTVPAPRGSTTPAPVPFFLSTTGYGLWLDTSSDATFDLNASDPANITIDVSTARLRIVIFTGGKDHPGRFPAILSAFAAAQPPAPTPSWLDFNDLPGSLTALLSAGLSGQQFPTAPPVEIPSTGDPVLLSRWLELLAFTPAAQPAGTSAIARHYAAIHDALAPYLATPRTLEPLIYEFQDDPAAREIHDEYLLGPGLLVAPAFGQNPTRLVYLPAGEWRNVFTGEKVTGPGTIVAATPADTIPFYARPDTNVPDLTSAAKPSTPQEP